MTKILKSGNVRSISLILKNVNKFLRSEINLLPLKHFKNTVLLLYHVVFRYCILSGKSVKDNDMTNTFVQNCSNAFPTHFPHYFLPPQPPHVNAYFPVMFNTFQCLSSSASCFEDQKAYLFEIISREKLCCCYCFCL